MLAADGHFVGVEREDFLAYPAFAEDQDGNVGAGDEGGLCLQLAHALGGTDEGVGFGELDLFGGVGGRLAIGEGEVFFDRHLDICGDERLHDDGANAAANDAFKLADLARAGEDDDGQVRARGADVGEQRKRILGGMRSDQNEIRFTATFDAIEKGFFLAEGMQGVVPLQRGTQVVEHRKVWLEKYDL